MSKEQKVLVSIPDQVRQALDGRTQRWLALKIRMPETDLSKKMNGSDVFTEEEILQINEALSCNIKSK